LKTKILSLIILTAALSILLTSCGGRYYFLDLDNSNTDGDEITLRFISPWAGSDVKSLTLMKVLENFQNSNPDIRVVNESMSGGDFLLKLKTDFVSGNAPDVFGLWPGANMLSLINAEKVADLTQLLEQDLEWKNTFDKSAWYYVTENGRTYGIPFEITYQAMFINKDIFDRNNIKIPENFTELKQVSIELRKAGIIPIAYNAQIDGGYIYQNIIASLGGRTETQRPFLKGGGVNGCFTGASEYMKGLFAVGTFPEDAFSLSDREMANLFLTKKAAMLVERSEFIGEIDKYAENPASVDILPFPAVEEGKADATAIIYGLGSGTFFISRDSWDNPAQKTADVKLLKYITSGEVSNLFVEEAKMLPAVKGDYPDAYYSGLMKRGRALIDGTKELIPPPDTVMDKSIWSDIIIKGLPYVLTGGRDAADLWAEAEKARY
jgi:raffinose/stachyose/melibiose transport system substrate-binding protein